MPGPDKKWDIAAERDLCVAVILGNQDAERVRHNWPKIHDFMEKLGYGFTKEAISQHFTKVIMKDFKSRHGNGPSRSTPTKRANVSKAASPVATRKRGKPVYVEEDSDAEEKPKKTKIENPETTVKAENSRRDRSATVVDTDTAFNEWLDGI